MTKVDVGFATEELQFDIVGEEAEVPNMSVLVDKDNSNNEILCMDTTQTDIISGLDNSLGPNRFSKLKDNRWKPYPEREKQRLEEQNTRRAILVQKEMLRCGLSLSPFCVPHFDDHRSDVDLEEKIASGGRHREISSSSSEEFFSCPDEDDESIRVPFDVSNKCLTIPDVSEYIGKSNQDLVKDFMEVEEKVDELREALKATRLHNQLSKRTLVFDVEAEMEKIRVYRKEIAKLTRENDHLLSENRKLHSILSDAD